MKMREIKQRIIRILDAQEKKGIETYGETLEDADIDPKTGNPYNWDLMALEELIDALQYQIKQNLLLEDELVQANGIIHELEADLDGCDDKVREMLYNSGERWET
jgi:hypothetical protein